MEDLFNFMKNHVLHFSSDVQDHLTCTFCKKVLVDSHFATNCGCKFCLTCITEYLLDGCKPCPSGKEACMGVILDLKIDIAKDVPSNVLISNLLLRCPHGNCNHECRLRDMPEHVSLCTNRPVECEFSAVGCGERVTAGEGMTNHLVTENVEHMRLLLGYLRQMMFRLNEAVELNERRNGEWQREKNELLKSMREMKEEMDEAKAVEEHTTNEMQRMMRINNELGSKMQFEKGRMEEMEAKMNENLENVTKILREEMEKKVKESEETVSKKLKEEISDEIRSSQDEQAMKLQELQEQSRKAAEIQLKQQKKIQQIQEMTHWGEFVWRVEKMSDKRRQAANGGDTHISSEYFFSHHNGYLTRLEMYPNGYGDYKGTHLLLYLINCTGPFDVVLKWPMNKKIRLAVINQKTGEEHIGYDYSYENDQNNIAKGYIRPTEDHSVVGVSRFISWDKLQENNDVLSNDVLVIKCSFAQ